MNPPEVKLDPNVYLRPRSAGLRVVAIGGGTGLSTLLKGLKNFVYPAKNDLISDLSAVVTVSDDGGSSGRLRKDFNMLPPGDNPQLHCRAVGR